MAIWDPILSKCTDMCLGKCAEIAWSHLGYVFHCSENIQKLKNEKDNLENEWTRINIMVESEKRNAKIILPDVENWKKSVEKMKEEIDEFLRDEQRKNMRCFKCGCPNIRWRYRLGKKSKSMTESVTSLKDEGNKYLAGWSVAHSPPRPELPSAHEHLSSRDYIFKGIMEALKDPHIKLIGVHGAGGVGKTTMVNEAGNKAKGKMLFDVVAMATVSQTMDKKKVQEDLASYLQLKLEGNEIERTNLLKHRLNNEKKNLIILDDVWEPLTLEDIGIPVLDGKNGCKVVVTSRRQDVFRNIMQNSVDQVDPRVVKEFRIDVLREEEARTLFLKTAGISDDSEMRDVADDLCRECGGLPVAILAVARALRGKEKYSWEDAVKQLKDSKLDEIVDIDPKLVSSLRLSYACLNSKDAQSCFLLCSLFPEDAKISIDDLVRYSFGMRLLVEDLDTLENVRNRVLALVKRLQEDYLLLDGGDENVVRMHDVIRDVAILIAKKEKGYHYLVKHNLKKWPERRNYESYLAISFRSENFHDLPDELECKQLHTLVLKCNERRYTTVYTTVPNNFFKGIENSLEILDLSDMPMESPPLSIAMLVKLRMLSLNGLTRDIALLGRLKSLEILILHGITELAPEINHLTRLRLLDLSKCHTLRVIPPNVISKLLNLEELYISHEFDQWDVEATNQERRNASLVELKSLNHLTALQVYIPETSMTLLSDSCVSELKQFRIWIGTESWLFVKYLSRRMLSLSNIITLEDKFKVLMNKAEVLYLNKLEGLREVCHVKDEMISPELKILDIRQCNNVEHIFGRPKMLQPTPRQQMSFGKLSSLHVYDCNKVKYLFSIFVARCFVKLQELIISHCEAIEEIVINERQEDDGALIFPKLGYMQLVDLPNLKSFCSSAKETSIKDVDNSNPAQPLFSDLVVFPSLSKLELSEIPNIKAIWNNTPPTNSFNNLKLLDVFGCDGLSYVAPSEVLGNLSKLKKLTVRHCDSLEEVFRNRGSNDCGGLSYVAQSEVAGNLSKLQSLNERQEDDGALIFPKLKIMELTSLPNLRSFCSSMKGISINDANNSKPAQPLFSEMVVFPSLSELELYLIPNMKAVWNNTPPTNSFNNLTSLEVWECGGLSYVAPSEVLGNLSKLKCLCVIDCGSIEEIFRSRGSNDEEGIVPTNVVLPHLSLVTLEDSPRLKSICSGIKFPSSVEWTIGNCPSFLRTE
ncbi:hypothetical protein U1Q18_001275, partial [Sarracenia purpurea var. burkii]